MKICVFAYSDQGAVLSLRVAECYRNRGEEVTCYAIEKFAVKYHLQAVPSTKEGVAAQFAVADLMIFIGACGIAVRAIAPCLQSKIVDPACVVVDDKAQFVIPILSGHIGGANEACVFLANALQALPVVTTATDVNNRFAVDVFAKKNQLMISSMQKAKAISAAILVQDVSISFGEGVLVNCHENMPLAPGVVQTSEGVLGVYIGYEKTQPYPNTLHLIPQMLVLGIGCKKGTPQEKIEALVEQVFREQGLSQQAIAAVASIDLKAEEEGLLRFCAAHEYPVQFYTAAQLQAVRGAFTASEFVKRTTGVDNICERAAIKGLAQLNDTISEEGRTEQGKLIVRKTSMDGVTLAVSRLEREVCFG